jgi:CheY-like chemotaxis protein
MNAPRRRVLLIDDTPEIAELLTFALRDRGYEVAAEGYDSAISERIAEHQADARARPLGARHEHVAVRRRKPSICGAADRPRQRHARESGRGPRARQAEHVLLIPKPSHDPRSRARSISCSRARSPLTPSPDPDP